MAHSRWQTIAGLMAVSTLAAGTDVDASAQHILTKPASAVRVGLDNLAGVDAATLASAKARTSEVFSLVGVDIEWADATSNNRGTGPTAYTVLVMADAPSTMKAAVGHLNDGLMGQAAPSVGRAYVYFDRVLADTVPLRGVAITLGDVIAHELGHLLLAPGHSSTGIMRSRIDRTSRRVETFSESQAAAIKSRLNADPQTDR